MPPFQAFRRRHARPCSRATPALFALLALVAPLHGASAQGAPAVAPAPATTAAVTGANAPTVLPAATFFRHPDFREATLSPSGKRLAVLVRAGERMALALVELDGTATARMLARFADTDIVDFDWVGEHFVVFRILDEQRGIGDQVRGSGLFSVAVDMPDAKPRMLVRTNWDFVTTAQTGRPPLEATHGLLAVPRVQRGAPEVIVGQATGRAGELHQIIPLRLNVETGSVTSIAQGMPDGATAWLFDAAGTPRLAASESQGRRRVFWREGEAWRLLDEADSDRVPWAPHSVGQDGRLYVTRSVGPKGEAVLTTFDTATGKLADQPLVSTPGFDFNGHLVRARDDGRVLGVRAETDAWTTVWFDARMAQWQKIVDARLPGRVNAISCVRCDSDAARLLVSSWSDQQPEEDWLFEPARGADAAWQRVTRARPDVDARRMATVDFHRFTARDGLDVPVWVTTPPGKSAAPRAAVVLVHGGPWVRGGHWRWHGEAQFLASRGWVVLEPEFRGSRGYGERLLRAGDKAWGTAMQDDLADAVRWAAGKGLVDPKRVCILGASYGGYAALMSPIRHPDVYRCAISAVGVVEPLWLLDTWDAWTDTSLEARRHFYPLRVGDPVKDAALLAAASPLKRAAELKTPLLIVHGAQDRRVPIRHANAMRAALREAGREPEWLVFGDEGHGWLKFENRLRYAEVVETFLGKHLK